MLRAIRRGLELPGAKDHPWFNECLCRFLLRMAEMKPEQDNLVHYVLFQQAKEVFGEPLPKASETNDAFLKRNAKSFLHVFRGKLASALQVMCVYAYVAFNSKKKLGLVNLLLCI